MSEKANKGILITTSDFTTQAKNFAKDKNLELINGSVLNSLIEGVDIKVEELQLKFYEMPEFDKNTYDFLKKRLKAGKKNEKNYDNLITLLESYILNGKVDICKAGLIEEIRHLREDKRINTNKDYIYNPNSNVIDLNELDLCFIEGNLAKATEELLKSKDFYFSEYPSFLSFYDAAFNLFDKNYQYDDKKYLSIFFCMDFQQDPWAKNLIKPSFLESLYNFKEFIKKVYKDNSYFVYSNYEDYHCDIKKYKYIEAIIDKNFTKLYSEEELKYIIKEYKRIAKETKKWNENDFDIYEYEENKDNILKTKPLFIQIAKESKKWNENDLKKSENNLMNAKPLFLQKLLELEDSSRYSFRDLFLEKFIPSINTPTFSRLANNISPLFGYPFRLMLYSAYKQIGYDKGCSELVKSIIIPKSIAKFKYIITPAVKYRKKFNKLLS